MDSEKGRQEMNLCNNNTSNALEALDSVNATQFNALDSISRQAAINALETTKRIASYELHSGEVLRTFNIVLNSLINIISLLPSKQPEPHWIPVTEGLPKEFGSYQVTTTHGKVAIYVFVPDSISSHEYWKRCVPHGCHCKNLIRRAR